MKSHWTLPARRVACWELALAAALTAAPASADDRPTFADRADESGPAGDRSVAFLLNPLAIAVGLYGGEVDIVLGRYAALALEGALYPHGDTLGEALGAGLLVYPLGGALQRFYVEPRFVYAHPLSLAKVDWGDDVVGLGGTAGWQWTWDYGLCVRAGAGALWFFGGSQADATSGALAIGPQIVLDGSLGWAF